MGKNPHISIIIVTWNNEKDIRLCLESVKEIDYPKFNVILVDDNSSDKTVAIVKAEFQNVLTFKMDRNQFLCKNNNFGINYAISHFNSEFVMVLNPDTKVPKDILKTLLGVMQTNEKIGASGPKIKFWNNPNEGKLNSTGLIYDGFMQSYDRGFMEDDNGQYDIEEEMPAVSGTCILYRVKALKETGLYWEPIKMYLDELELAIRLRKKGWKIIYTPKTTIGHSYMKSADENKLLKVKHQQAKAYLLIALRHYPMIRKLAMIKKYIEFKAQNLKSKN